MQIATVTGDMEGALAAVGAEDSTASACRLREGAIELSDSLQRSRPAVRGIGPASAWMQIFASPALTPVRGLAYIVFIGGGVIGVLLVSF